MMKTMNEHRDALVRVLRRECETADRIDAAMKERQQAFIRWHTADLQSVLDEERTLLEAMALLEKERTALVRAMSAGRGRLLSMSEIVAADPSPELETVYRDLRAVSARIIRRNNQNRDLLQSSMSFVRRTLSFITGNFRYKLLDQKV